jgi:hypothetical protein
MSPALLFSPVYHTFSHTKSPTIRFIGQFLFYNSLKIKQGGTDMKGYFVSGGYMGLVGGSYQLFATESDYLEYLAD